MPAPKGVSSADLTPVEHHLDDNGLPGTLTDHSHDCRARRTALQPLASRAAPGWHRRAHVRPRRRVGQHLRPGRADRAGGAARAALAGPAEGAGRSEEHTSELQSLMRISYAVFCMTKKQAITHIY